MNEHDESLLLILADSRATPSNTCRFLLDFDAKVSGYGTNVITAQLEAEPFVFEELELDYSSCPDDSALIESTFEVQFVDGTDKLGKQMTTYAKVGLFEP